MFAGHTESGGEIIERDGKLYKSFYGMASATAMKKHAGGVAEYRFVHCVQCAGLTCTHGVGVAI